MPLYAFQCFPILSYTFLCFKCFSHALIANVSQEQQQQQEDSGSLVYRLYLRKPVKKTIHETTERQNHFDLKKLTDKMDKQSFGKGRPFQQQLDAIYF